MRPTVKAFAVAAVCALTAAGCVANKKFEDTVSDISSRIDDVQAGVEENSQAIEKLDAEVDEVRSEAQSAKSVASQAQAGVGEAKQLAAKAEKAARGKVIWQVTLTNRDVTFGVDKADLGPDAAAKLDDLIARFKSLDKLAFIEIQGHTDSTGSERYNEQLGLERAEAVRNYLHEHGVPLNLMSVISYGETRPVADNSTPEGRAANRRVEVMILE